MAQVKKLQPGGTTPEVEQTTPQEGSLTINGKVLYGQTALDRLKNAYAGSPQDEREMWRLADQAIRNKHHVEYNPAANSIVIKDSDGSDVTNTYNTPRAHVNDSGFKRFGDAFFNDRAHRFKKSGRYMSMVDMNPNTKEEIKTLPDLMRGDGSNIYSRDKDGKRVYTNGPSNQYRETVINGIRTYLDNPNDRTNYNVSWKKDMDILTNYYDKLDADSKNAFWNNLWNNIRSGNLTDSDKEFLDLFNYQYGDETTNGNENGDQNRDNNRTWGAPTGWKGNQAALQAGNIIITKGDDGGYYVTGDNKYKNTNWYLGGTKWAEGTDFANGFLINGRLYTENEALNPSTEALKQILMPWMNAGYAGQTWRNWYDAVNRSGIRFEGDRNGVDDPTNYGVYTSQYNPSTMYSKTWDSAFKLLGADKTWDVADLTSGFLTADGNVNTTPILSLINPNKVSATGVPTPIYIAKHKNTSRTLEDGRVVPKVYTNINDLMRDLGVTAANNPYGYRTEFKANTYKNIKGKNYAELAVIKGMGGDNTFLIGQDGNYYLAIRKQGSDEWAEPKLIKNIEQMQKMIANPNGTWTNAAFESLYLKNGGVIESHQFGGPLSASRTNMNLTETGNSGTAISDAHKINETDGGLTREEKLKLAAAVGDLAGLGFAFIPGASGIFAAMGAASSLAMFKADTADGIDSEDIGTLGLNLFMDTATILPFIGGLAKSTKAAKVIKSIGSIGVKALSAYGFIDGATALTNVMNGKDPTSEDLQKIIYGLSSTVAGGMSTIHTAQDAKLAKQMEETLNKTAKASRAEFNKKEFDLKFTKDGKEETGKLTREKLSELIEGKTAEEIKTILTKEFGEVSDGAIKSLLDEAGFDYKKIPGMKFWADNNGKTVATLTQKPTQTAVKEHSTVSYFLNPFTRNQVTEKGLGTLNRAQVQELLWRQNNMASAAARRASIENPNQFGIDFNGIYRTPGKWAWGADQYGRTVKPGNELQLSYRIETPKAVENPSTLVDPNKLSVKGKLDLNQSKYSGSYKSSVPGMDNSGIDPFVRLKAITDEVKAGILTVQDALMHIKNVPELMDAAKYLNDTGVLYPEFKSAIESGFQYKSPKRKKHKRNYGADRQQQFDKYMAAQREARQAIGWDLFKDGGVLKFQPGGNVIDWTKYIAPVPEENIKEKLPVLSKKTLRKSLRSKDENEKEAAKFYAKQHNIFINDLGGDPDKDIYWNLPNIDDMTNAGLNVLMAQKNNKLQKDMIDVLKRRQFQTPEEQLKAYNFDDINIGANNQREAILARPLVGSDMNSMIAQNEVRNQQVASIEANRASAIGQRKSQIDEYNLGAINRNTASRIGTANTKSQYITGLDAQKIGSDIETNNTIMSQILNPLSQQLRQQNRQTWDQNRQFAYNEAKTKAEQSLQARAKASPDYAALTKEYNTAVTNGNTTASFEDWISMDSGRSARYDKIFEKDSLYFDDLRNAANLYTNSGAGTIMYRKKGGYVRSATDQITIDTNRNAQKASQKFSESLQKTIMQLMKIK